MNENISDEELKRIASSIEAFKAGYDGIDHLVNPPQRLTMMDMARRFEINLKPGFVYEIFPPAPPPTVRQRVAAAFAEAGDRLRLAWAALRGEKFDGDW